MILLRDDDVAHTSTSFIFVVGCWVVRGEHGRREIMVLCGTVKADAPDRNRAAARLVMAHFMVDNRAQ